MKIWHFAILKLQRHHCKGLPSLSQDTPCLLLILHVSKCRVYNLCVWITTTSHDLGLPKHDWFRGNRRKKDLRYLIFFQVFGGSTKTYVYIYTPRTHTYIHCNYKTPKINPFRSPCRSLFETQWQTGLFGFLLPIEVKALVDGKTWGIFDFPSSGLGCTKCNIPKQHQFNWLNSCI